VKGRLMQVRKERNTKVGQCKQGKRSKMQRKAHASAVVTLLKEG